ncbi:MAG: BlaI/MecI/CopY family transcriptional regulator, partial [Bacteroidota bacterium]
MSSKQIPRPTESELAILKVLWEKGPATVRQVNEAMNEARDAKAPAIKYTTTLKLMQIMYQEKQLLRRDETQRTHVYEAMVKEQDMQLKLLVYFMAGAFASRASFIASLTCRT